jgi:hypothetical protein
MASSRVSGLLALEIGRSPGRPKIDRELRDLIRQMSKDNPLWGAPRIHGELLKLGFKVAESTVSKYLVKRRGPPSQSWRTFLRNHADAIVAIDLCVVPTISFECLFAFLVIDHGRRRLLWFAVTRHPTAEWLAQQIVEAFPWGTAPLYLIRDNDGAFGQVFTNRVRRMGIRDRPISPRPWQNPHVERLIGTLRRHCLDHVLIFGEQHLRQILTNDLSQVLGVHTGRECCRTDKVREHHCDLATLGGVLWESAALLAAYLKGLEKPSMESKRGRAAARSGRTNLSEPAANVFNMDQPPRPPKDPITSGAPSR